MNRYILAGCAGLLAAVLASPIFAADLKPILKAPAYKAPVYVAPFSWSGFYVGAFGGYGVGSSSWVNSATGVGTNNFRVRGFVAGGTAGYNLQTGEWVWGVEADAGGSWINGTTNAGCAPGCETKNIWRATARGRIGHAWERWLPYLTGGAAFVTIRGAREHNLKNVDRRDSARQAGGVHRPVGLGQILARLRHHLCRGPAPLCRACRPMRASSWR
jgi:hypothetical protein